jgi:hypothetical protein
MFARSDRCATFASESASPEQRRNARQSLGMTSAASNLSLSAFATAASGCEYLTTAEHYQYLAKGIVDSLHRGCLVLVTGTPPADLPMLATALKKASAPRPVIELPCGPDLDCAQLFTGGSVSPDASAPVTIGADAGPSAPSPPIYLLADADRLSDAQIEEFYEAAHGIRLGPHGSAVGVLLVRPDFLARAENAASDLVDDGLATHLRVQQLDRGEVGTFIRRQLPTEEGENLFTAQRVTLIAIASGGDPAGVNRAARRILQTELDVSAGGRLAKFGRAWRQCLGKPSSRPDADGEDDEIPPPRVMPRRHAVSLRLPAGIVICLGAAWLVAGGTFQPQDLGALVDLARDHILPRIEQAGARSGAEAAPSPVGGLGSPSVNLTLVPPTATSADRTTPQPGADAGYPGATSLRAPPSEPAPQPAADGQPLSAPEIAALVARGDILLAAGDIASARLLFERATDSRDSRAAMRLAVTYDAAFLERAGVHGLRGDPERAAFWYRRARELSDGKP